MDPAPSRLPIERPRLSPRPTLDRSTRSPPGSAPSRLDRWRDRWLAWRDRLLASPVFQRRAAAFAPSRPTARRHAQALFDLVAGFVYSQTLLACVELDLFELLAREPLTADQLVPRLGLAPDALQRLLDAAVALKLLERRSRARYGLGPLGAPMVGNHAVVAMIRHHAALYADLAHPLALLRATPEQRARNALARYWAYDDARAAHAAPEPDQRVATYSALMAASQPLVADEVLGAYRLSAHRCLLDVGGGDGRFIETVAARVPDIRLMLFDLPAVAERARARFSQAGIDARATACGGSFLHDALPRGADVVSLIRVVHDHDDSNAMAILRAVHAALPSGGTLLLAEPMAGTKGAEAMGDAYFGMYLWAMGRGRPRRAEELTRMLSAAGFASIRAVPTRMPLQTRLLVATATGVNPQAVDVNQH